MNIKNRTKIGADWINKMGMIKSQGYIDMFRMLGAYFISYPCKQSHVKSIMLPSRYEVA